MWLHQPTSLCLISDAQPIRVARSIASSEQRKINIVDQQRKQPLNLILGTCTGLSKSVHWDSVNDERETIIYI